MVDIPRAVSYLLNTQWVDGGKSGPGTDTPQAVRELVLTIQKRTPSFRSTDPEFGAIGNGSSNPISGFFPSATTPALLAAVTVGTATPYSWTTNAAYGLVFTQTTTASTASGSTLPMTSLSGDLANPLKILKVGMSVVGTNIAANSTISSISFTSTTPNLIDGPLLGTITLNNAITGTVASGATLTFSYTSTMMQALEMDWLGIQAAEYAAGTTASYGGRHTIPAGSYICNRPIMRYDTPAGGSSNINQTLLAGEGKLCTRVTFPDFGPGTWAITPPNRTTGGTIANSEIRDIWIQGPGNGLTMGTAGCQGHGIALGISGIARDVACQGFWSGITPIGDHWQVVGGCLIQNNFCNIYFGPLTGQSNGDWVIRDSWTDGSTWCSIGCSGTSQMTYGRIDRVHGGFGPYGFYKWTGATTNFIIATVAARVSMESCGNGVIYDENAAGLIAGSQLDIDGSLDSTNFYEITSRTTYAMWRVGNINQNCTLGGTGNDPYTAGYNRSTHPCTLGIIVCQQGFQDSLVRSAAGILAVGSTTFAAVQAGYASPGTLKWDTGVCSGTFRSTNGAITAGTFCANTDYGVAITPSATHPGIIGMAVYGASGSIGAALIPVATGGVTTANKHTSTDVIASGIWLQISSATAGDVVAFNSGARTCTVGRVWSPTTSGQTTVSIEVDIKGP